MSENKEIIPIALHKAAEELKQSLLPDKSKKGYENGYNNFKNWCDKNGVQSNVISETVVLAYFGELAQNKKPSTLWSTYSMLRTVINIKHNCDISKFPLLMAFLKNQNIGYIPKKSNVFSMGEINKFLNTAPSEYLPEKVTYTLSIYILKLTIVTLI